MTTLQWATLIGAALISGVVWLLVVLDLCKARKIHEKIRWHFIVFVLSWPTAQLGIALLISVNLEGR